MAVQATHRSPYHYPALQAGLQDCESPNHSVHGRVAGRRRLESPQRAFQSCWLLLMQAACRRCPRRKSVPAVGPLCVNAGGTNHPATRELHRATRLQT